MLYRGFYQFCDPYPLLVTQKTEKSYFKELVEPILHKSGFILDIPRKEKSHTKSNEVEKLFNDLNKKCEECFVRVELTGCQRVFSGKPELQKGKRDDEVMIYLPPDYRIDGKATRFRICLDKKTRPEQKEKVEKMIREYLE